MYENNLIQNFFEINIHKSDNKPYFPSEQIQSFIPDRNFDDILREQIIDTNKYVEQSKKNKNDESNPIQKKNAISADEKETKKTENNNKEPIKTEKDNEKRLTHVDNANQQKSKVISDLEKNNPVSERLDVNLLLNDLKSILTLLEDNKTIIKEIKELKAFFTKLHNSFLEGNSGLKNTDLELKKIITTIKKLLWKLDSKIGFTNALSPGKDVEKEKDQKLNFVDISELKKQISKLTEEVNRYTVRLNKESVAVSDINDPKISKQLLNESAGFNEPRGAKIKEGNNSWNNDASTDFQFNKRESNNAGILKQSSAVFQKRNSFNEQMDSILRNAKVVVKDSRNGSFSMRLFPQSLGRVNVNLNLEHGVILGKFLVESMDAKEALLQNMSAIKENLEQNGISVGDFLVNVRDDKNSSSEFNKEDNLETMQYESDSEFTLDKSNEYDLNSLSIYNGQIDMII